MMTESHGAAFLFVVLRHHPILRGERNGVAMAQTVAGSQQAGLTGVDAKHWAATRKPAGHPR